MHKFIHILVFIFFSLLACFAKAQPDADTTLYYNNLNVPPDSVNTWKNATAFKYILNLDSLLKEKKGKAKKYIRSGPGFWDKLLSSYGTKVFFWVLASIFIFFILYKLFLTKGVFTRTTTTVKSDTPEVAEEALSNESDFDTMINKALQNGNYRLAVRYQYLKTLHKLSNKNIVELAVDKTNYQYVKELANKVYQNDFASLTMSYEYVWYGEFVIEENTYRKIEAGFMHFNKKISN